KKQEVDQSKDDADLRQLVDFMKKEIESYKDREKRYLDQIDRFQLLLGHKESEEKMSHDTPNRHLNETPCDNNDDSSESIENKSIEPNSLSHDTVTRHTSEAPKNVSQTHHETRKKRSLFGRVLSAVFDED
ncbi:plasmid replication DNA-binding protein, partial [Acinetobacter baumannii]